jgi:hypothetical protein
MMAAMSKGINYHTARAWLPTVSGCVPMIYLDKALEEWKALYPDRWRKIVENSQKQKRPLRLLQPLQADIDKLLMD